MRQQRGEVTSVTQGTVYSYCQKAFSCLCNFNRWKSTVYQKLSIYLCDICETDIYPLCTRKWRTLKAVTTKNTLGGRDNYTYAHVTIFHQRKKKHVYVDCKKTFGSNSDLMNHISAVHPDIRPSRVNIVKTIISWKFFYLDISKICTKTSSYFNFEECENHFGWNLI